MARAESTGISGRAFAVASVAIVVGLGAVIEG